MAVCENATCGKTGLRKEDVEYDENLKLILCHGCYVQAHPGWMPPSEIIDLTADVPALGYAFSINNIDGFRARVSYGGASVSFHAPTEDIRKLLKF